MSAAGAVLSERRMVADGLRMSARLADPVEAGLMGAAVELVLRAQGGEFADPGWPWVVEGDPSEPFGLFRLDPDAMAVWDQGRPEHPVMDFVETLAGGRPVRRLPGLLRILDKSTVRLILTAFHHATAADAEVAVYAFGGDPWRVVDDAPATWRFWTPCWLDRFDRLTPLVQPQLTALGGRS